MDVIAVIIMVIGVAAASGTSGPHHSSDEESTHRVEQHTEIREERRLSACYSDTVIYRNLTQPYPLHASEASRPRSGKLE